MSTCCVPPIGGTHRGLWADLMALCSFCKPGLVSGGGGAHAREAEEYWGRVRLYFVPAQVLPCGQSANDSFLSCCRFLKPQVLFYSGKFISCGFAVKRK